MEDMPGTYECSLLSGEDDEVVSIQTRLAGSSVLGEWSRRGLGKFHILGIWWTTGNAGWMCRYERPRESSQKMSFMLPTQAFAHYLTQQHLRLGFSNFNCPLSDSKNVLEWNDGNKVRSSDSCYSMSNFTYNFGTFVTVVHPINLLYQQNEDMEPSSNPHLLPERPCLSRFMIHVKSLGLNIGPLVPSYAFRFQWTTWFHCTVVI